MFKLEFPASLTVMDAFKLEYMLWDSSASIALPFENILNTAQENKRVKRAT